jgi:hypothetical protein
MERRSIEMPQEPESEDEAGVDAEESQREPGGVDVIILLELNPAERKPLAPITLRNHA